MKFNKECLRRAWRTFIQAAVAYITVNIVLIDFSGEKSVVKSAVTGLIVSAVSAGLAAVMNISKGGCAVDNG